MWRSAERWWPPCLVYGGCCGLHDWKRLEASRRSRRWSEDRWPGGSHVKESEDSEVRKEDERRRRRAARMVVEVMAVIVAMEQEVRVKPQAKRAETAALPVPVTGRGDGSRSGLLD